MQYMMFVATDTEPDDSDTPEPDVQAWVDELDAKGIRIRGERLRPAEEGKTVRVRRGELLVTDGPFTEAKEWIAGYDILECDSLEQAIEVASRHPMARAGRIEVRAFWPFEG
ncbi:YciI family protein [Rathayibacter sp. YIM 133350]|uniref:YciI family protein n=1 Tax=Rathayibacter sp. YIM 133350 TaxID=3131992 RepID=UPI00307D3A9D